MSITEAELEDLLGELETCAGPSGIVQWRQHPLMVRKLVRLYRKSGWAVGLFSTRTGVPVVNLKRFHEGRYVNGDLWPELTQLLSVVPERVEESAPPEWALPKPSIEHVITQMLSAPRASPRNLALLNYLEEGHTRTEAAAAFGVTHQRITQLLDRHQMGGITQEDLRTLFTLDVAKWLPRLPEEEREVVSKHIVARSPIPRKIQGQTLRRLKLAQQRLSYLASSPLQEDMLLEFAARQDSSILPILEDLLINGKIRTSLSLTGPRKLRLLLRFAESLRHVSEEQAEVLLDRIRHLDFLPQIPDWVARKLARTQPAPNLHPEVLQIKELVALLRTNSGQVRWGSEVTSAARVVRAFRRSGLPLRSFCRHTGVSVTSMMCWLRGRSLNGKVWSELVEALTQEDTAFSPDPRFEEARALIEHLRDEEGRVRWRQDLQAVLQFLELWRSSGLPTREWARGVRISKGSLELLLTGRTRGGVWPELRAAFPCAQIPHDAGDRIVQTARGARRLRFPRTRSRGGSRA